MLDATTTAVEAIQAKQVRKPAEPIAFSFAASDDGYRKDVGVYDKTGHRLCVISQSIGHCCAASMVGSLSAYGFWKNKTKVNAFIAEMKRHWKDQHVFFGPLSTRLSLFNISGFYVLLSPETAGFDKALREHEDIVKVHSFKNKRNGPREDYSFSNTIDLYFMEF